MNSQISISNLSFSYGNNIVLENVSFTIKKNEIVTIIGPNGGGKTTLLRLIAGLLIPDTGTILINEKPPQYNRGCIGYVPQHTQFDKKFPITVFEVVLSGLVRQFGFYTRKDKFKTEVILESTGLETLKDRPFNNLSGGQSQRMLIARALVSDASILLLDEPTSNIDSNSEKNLNSLIKNISKKMTILLVTHDTGFVSNITDRVFCINKSIIEHPIDKNFSEIIASSYGFQNKIVRHETSLP